MGVRSRGEGSRAAPAGPVHETEEKDLRGAPGWTAHPLANAHAIPKRRAGSSIMLPPRHLWGTKRLGLGEGDGCGQ